MHLAGTVQEGDVGLGGKHWKTSCFIRDNGTIKVVWYGESSRKWPTVAFREIGGWWCNIIHSDGSKYATYQLNTCACLIFFETLHPIHVLPFEEYFWMWGDPVGGSQVVAIWGTLVKSFQLVLPPQQGHVASEGMSGAFFFFGGFQRIQGTALDSIDLEENLSDWKWEAMASLNITRMRPGTLWPSTNKAYCSQMIRTIERNMDISSINEKVWTSC